MATEIEEKYTRKRNFEEEPTTESEENESTESMRLYLRKDYLVHVESAIRAYLQSIDVDENFVQSRFHLGKMMAATYDFREALKHFNHVIVSIKPADTKYEEQMHVFYERGMLYLAMEDEREILYKKTNSSK